LLLATGVFWGGASTASPKLAPRYLITDLGTLEDSRDVTFGLGLNAAGQAVGTGRTTTGSRPQIAFRWDRGEMVNLGTLVDSTFSRAFTLNSAGFAVGEAFTSPATGEQSRAILWAPDGTLTDLGGFVSGGVANGINDSNVVVGTSTQATAQGNAIRAFRWEDGALQDLGTLSTVVNAQSRGNRINAAGHVVGSSHTDVMHEGSRVTHAFLWRDGVLTDLGSLGDDPDEHFSTALELNDVGQVVGEAVVGEVTTSSGHLAVQHAFLWENGEMTDLGTLGTLRHSRATDINNLGQIVGHSTQIVGSSSSARAVTWENGGIQDLNDLIPLNTRWVLQTAEAINDRGEIIGYGTYVGQTRAYLLTPIDPAPTNLTATATSATQVNLAWSDTSRVEEGWIVERRTPSGDYASVAVLGPNSTAYTDANLTAATSYVYRVRATTIAGDLGSSNEAAVTTEPSVLGGILQVSRTVNFGVVRRGRTRTESLVLRNNSRSETLRVSIGAAEGPFSVTSGGGTVLIAPRGRHAVELAYTPGVRGAARESLNVTSSDTRRAEISVRLLGIGR